MMPSALLHDSGSTPFLSERFDRKGTEKIHIQTLAALRPDAGSYEELFRTAFDLGVTQQEMSELFRRMAFNVYSGNVDDHNKNFSFQMSRSGKWSITPAYDLTFTVNLSQPWYTNKRCMTINMNDDEITDKDMLVIATQFDIQGASGIMQQVKQAISNYGHYAQEAGVDSLWASRIQAELSKRMEVALSGNIKKDWKR